MENGQAEAHSYSRKRETVPGRVEKAEVSTSPVKCVTYSSQPSTQSDFLEVLCLKPMTRTPSPTTHPREPWPFECTLDLPEAIRWVPIPEHHPTALRLDDQEDAVLQREEPLSIHGYSVEEYQEIYHSVVDDMMKYKSGRPRPYSLHLGRMIKQRLWESLGRPKLTITEHSDGILEVKESLGRGIYPPFIPLDVSGEPDPGETFRKQEQYEN